jgi:4-hydroxybenzoate polyprenyltransferase/phosphoserine phosphatase
MAIPDGNHLMDSPGTNPIAVDLDGTLARTDTLVESLFALLRERPAAALGLLPALAGGRARLKARLAAQVELDPALLPLNAPLVEWLQAQRDAGRRLVLVTAADQRIAHAVAARVGLFDAVMASDGTQNLKGATKAAALVERFGAGGFDYVGDAWADLPVWRAARRAIVVGGERLVRAARGVAEVERVFPPPVPLARALPRALRPHQWVKNLLLFLPLLAAHLVTDGPALAAAMLAFVAFGLTASAVYLLNDLLDLPADRRHPRKRHRPFAAGDLSLATGLALVPALLGAAALLALLLPPAFAAILAGYFVITSAYSFGLKRVPVVDVMLLAGLYTVRVVAGAAAVAIMPSFWLLAFSMFIFLSLALVKRYTELDALRARGELTASGRGWHVDDLPLVQSLGVSAGLICVLVLALYIDSTSAQALYALPEALWLVCPALLYWVSRLWLKTHRGEVHDDPVVFALRDRVSLIIGAVTALIVALAAVGLGAGS